MFIFWFNTWNIKWIIIIDTHINCYFFTVKVDREKQKICVDEIMEVIIIFFLNLDSYWNCFLMIKKFIIKSNVKRGVLLIRQWWQIKILKFDLRKKIYTHRNRSNDFHFLKRNVQICMKMFLWSFVALCLLHSCAFVSCKL